MAKDKKGRIQRPEYIRWKLDNLKKLYEQRNPLETHARFWERMRKKYEAKGGRAYFDF